MPIRILDDELVNKIAAETARIVRQPDIREKMPAWGGDSAGTTPQEFEKKYREDIARYARILKQANVPLVD